MPNFAPTVQQQDFINSLVDTDNNIALVARAGSGKTSAILMGVDAVREADPSAEVLVCAFNKAIADEVSTKLKKAGHRDWKTVQASTLHSLGFGLFKRMFNPKVDDKKIHNLVDKYPNVMLIRQYRQQIISLVRYAKQAGVGFFDDVPTGNVQVWHDLASHFDINGLEETTQMDQIVEVAQRIYVESYNQTNIIDFDDMILFPLIKNISTRFTKDFVFLDEAQDLSRSRQALAKKFIKPHTGRIIIVGDDRQAIYGFSGADAAALDNLITSTRSAVLPLSITWRCPKVVVDLAKTIVPDIEAAPTAHEGEIRYEIGLSDDLEPTKDAILCRNTAPLIDLAYRLIRQGKPCKVEGRSIGEGLIKLARRWKVEKIEKLLERLEAYREREMQKAMAKGDETKAEQVADKVQTLVEICTACNLQQKYSVDDVVEFIDNLFADGEDDVITLATYHRAKGREWVRVTLWEHEERCPSRGARLDWQLHQEENLAYVAFTRVLDTLIFAAEEVI